jgi:2-keto-4-pentenoate hydratase/2-oxohepta-3-ene-1,7-dioic acid hydratase in catechol pathway
MRLATFPYKDATSAAVVFVDGAVGLVRTLRARDGALDVGDLIRQPLRAPELEELRRAAITRKGIHPLPPLLPPKNVICVGKNYAKHAIEGARAEGLKDAALPKEPIWFTKPRTCLIGDQQQIVAPPGYGETLDYEGELAVVIGRKAHGLTKETALQAVFGYTVFNDITARAVQQGRKQWFKGKSADTFGPIGPWVVTADEIGDPQTLRVTTHVNGEMRQEGDTRDMIFPVVDLLVDLTQSITLEPGDIISTGTPSGVAWGMDKPRYLQPGDRVVVEISGIGRLENSVASAM